MPLRAQGKTQKTRIFLSLPNPLNFWRRENAQNSKESLKPCKENIWKSRKRSLGNDVRKNGVHDRVRIDDVGSTLKFRIGFSFGENSAGFCRSLWLLGSILNFRIGSVSSIGGLIAATLFAATTQRTQVVNYYAVYSVFTTPPDLLRWEPFFERKNVCNSQENGVHTRCAAIVNHHAIANALRRVNLLRCSIFSTAGSLGHFRFQEKKQGKEGQGSASNNSAICTMCWAFATVIAAHAPLWSPNWSAHLCSQPAPLPPNRSWIARCNATPEDVFTTH